MEETIIRLRMTAHGVVQGVGFRWRAQHAAHMLGVTGWARNNWDGTVEMEAQGTKQRIDDMLTMVGRGAYVTIEHIDYRSIPLEAHETDFRIRDCVLPGEE